MASLEFASPYKLIPKIRGHSYMAPDFSIFKEGDIHSIHEEACIFDSSVPGRPVVHAAEDHGYKLSVTKDGKEFTTGNPKSDAEQLAYVYVTDHNLIATDRVYISVWDSTNPTTGLNCTGEHRITGNSRNLLDYTVATSKNQPMFLQLHSLVNSAWVKGHWFS